MCGSESRGRQGLAMSEHENGTEFLRALRGRDPGKAGSFSAFSAFLGRKARQLGVPLNGQFELTPLCNFRCEMCYVRMDPERLGQPLLTSAQWNSLISAAVEAGMLHVTLSGGECLTYPGFRAVYEHIQHLGCGVEIFTNGSLLDEGWIGYFKQHPPAGIHITLYGDSEDAYERVTGQRAFGRVLHSIRRINEEKLPLHINVTPCRALGDDVFGTIRLASELSRSVMVNHLLSQPREETGRADAVRDLDEGSYIRILQYQNELKGVRTETCPAELLPPEGGPDRDGVRYGVLCGAGRSGFNVNWHGVMTPCNELESICAHPLEIGFMEAWARIREAVSRWQRAAACEGCPYEMVCESCVGRVAAFAEPGTWPHALCERTKRFVRQGVYPVPECEAPPSDTRSHNGKE